MVAVPVAVTVAAPVAIAVTAPEAVRAPAAALPGPGQLLPALACLAAKGAVTVDVALQLPFGVADALAAPVVPVPRLAGAAPASSMDPASAAPRSIFEIVLIGTSLTDTKGRNNMNPILR